MHFITEKEGKGGIQGKKKFCRRVDFGRRRTEKEKDKNCLVEEGLLKERKRRFYQKALPPLVGIN